MARTWWFVVVFSAVLGGTQLVNLMATGKPRTTPPSPAQAAAAVAEAEPDRPAQESPPPQSSSVAGPTPVAAPPRAVRSSKGSFAAAAPLADPAQEIIQLYRTGKLFQKNHYLSVRAAFARDFAVKRAGDLRRGFGEDHDRIMAWLDSRRSLKEDLFTSLDETDDRPANALAVFRSLWLWSPAQVEANPDLAIATAVVWDTESVGSWDSLQLVYRCNARATGPAVRGLGNFQYAVGNLNQMSLPLGLLPWEMLTFVVDHSTPLAERDWARGYVRQNPEACWYLDVPYDYDLMKLIIRTPGNFTPKMSGRDYSLSNLRTYGGVCAQRGDFAARVGKSVGVPSFYSSWAGTPERPGHAWSAHLKVLKMWGEQIDVACDYVGKQTAEGNWSGRAVDPQTGKSVHERDVERRWWVVGQDRVAKRQAILAMRGYPWLKTEMNLDAGARCAYLERCLQLNLFDERTWLELGRMTKTKDFPDNVVPPFLKERLDNLTFTAGRFPDFVVAQYDAVLGAFRDPGDRIHYYRFALKMCTNQRRPELESAVRRKIAALQKFRW